MREQRRRGELEGGEELREKGRNCKKSSNEVGIPENELLYQFDVCFLDLWFCS